MSELSDFWDQMWGGDPNLAGATSAKVADTRAKYASPTGSLDPNHITRDTLTQYGVPQDAADDASPYLSTYKMNHDIDSSVLKPREKNGWDYLASGLTAAAIPFSFNAGSGGRSMAGQMLQDNYNTRSMDEASKLRSAQMESTIKNAHELTGNIDKTLADQMAERQRMRKAKQFGLKEGTPEWTQYGLTGQYNPTQGMTDDQREFAQAKSEGFKGTIVDYFNAKSTKGGSLPPYKLNPDGTQTFVPGGPADPKTVSTLSEARGRGGLNVPQTVRTAGIQADQAYNNLTPLLDNYAKLVEKTGAVWLPGPEKDSVLRERRGIQLQLKELFNLGVLNGPDLSLMDTMLYDPNVNLNPLDKEGGITNAFYPVTRAKKSVEDLKEMLRGIRNNKTRILGYPDIGADGKPVPGTGARTSVGTAAPDADSQVHDYSDMSDDEIKAQLGIQ